PQVAGGFQGAARDSLRRRDAAFDAGESGEGRVAQDAGVVRAVNRVFRHCERIEAIHRAAKKVWIASSLSLLAMTAVGQMQNRETTICGSQARHPSDGLEVSLSPCLSPHPLPPPKPPIPSCSTAKS